MINPFKKKVHEVIEKVVVLIDPLFFFPKDIELNYNEGEKKYEVTTRLPLLDENGEIVKHCNCYLSIESILITMGLCKEYVSSVDDYLESKYQEWDKLTMSEVGSALQKASEEEKKTFSNYMIEKWKRIAEL